MGQFSSGLNNLPIVMPDYDSAIQIGSGVDYTVPCAGVFVSPTDIYINGIVRYEFFESSGVNTANCMTALVSKGDVCRTITSVKFIYFYPLKRVS